MIVRDFTTAVVVIDPKLSERNCPTAVGQHSVFPKKVELFLLVMPTELCRWIGGVMLEFEFDYSGRNFAISFP